MLKRWLIHTFAVIGAAILANLFGLGFAVHLTSLTDFIVLMFGVAVLGFLNSTIGPILKFLSFPVILITLGLFALVINALVLMLAGSLQWGFHFTQEGFPKFVTALIVSVFIAILNGMISGLFGGDSKRAREDD
ncbi:MAG: phage holin family protein [Fimbriimonadaceae bacterium]